ncbi:MAG TPA: hypothetical protein VI172_17710 [Candidatus Dormibacteraeota bacterium]|jgi:hypothetical protein
MKGFLVAVFAGLVLAACGSTAIGGGTNPSPSPTAGDRFDVTATEADHAITVHAGQTLELVLHKQNGLNNWSHPSSSDESLLTPIVDTAASAARGVTLAAFKAQKPGSVDVTATASPICPSGAMCPMYVALYSLRVTITG